MKILVIIPARFASTRFPGKPLAMINGISMINRVYIQAGKSSLAAKVIVATDDIRIKSHVEDFGGMAVMTSSSHSSGTERCAEAYDILLKANPSEMFDVIINLQGDEPLIDPDQIDLLGKCFLDRKIMIATLIKKINLRSELPNPNIVKVAIDNQNKALLFSRSVIPYIRDADASQWTEKHQFFRHIGIYAFNPDTLNTLVRLPKSSLEIAESLEQMRWLQNGYDIHTAITDAESFAVDTPDDLSTIIQHLNKL